MLICSVWPIDINLVLYLFCQINEYHLLLEMGEQNGAVRESDLPTGSKGGIVNQVLLNLDLVLLPADKLPVKLMNYESW